VEMELESKYVTWKNLNDSELSIYELRWWRDLREVSLLIENKEDGLLKYRMKDTILRYWKIDG